MAASAIPTLPPTPVQELIKTAANQIPERYLLSDANKPSDDQSEIKYMDSAPIDFNLLLDSSSNQLEELQKLLTNLSSWGCFQLINHGVSSSLLNRIREVHKEFFVQPIEVKQKYARTLDMNDGYGNDSIAEGESFMWNDRLILQVHPAEQKKFKFWPQDDDVPNFKETLEEYTKEVRRMLEILLKAIAKSLNIEENLIYKECEGEHGTHMFARFNYFPPCSFPELVCGLRPHTDSGVVTFLLQDKEVEGLQVQKDNIWYKVPIIRCIFIIASDQLEIMSNGLVKSAMHKVVLDKGRERKSLAIACAPYPEKEIGPFGELIDEERPQRYKRIKNYVGLFVQYTPKTIRVIDTLKI